MIRITRTTTKKAEVSWDTGLEFQYLKRLQELIEYRNEIVRKYKK